jgi:proline iminopeptidase
MAYEEHFKNTHNILTYDIRGHGKTQRFAKSSDYALKHFALDLEHLTRHLGLEPFVLISHSFGTMVALEYLQTNQDRVRAAVFLSPILTAWNSVAAYFIAPLLKLVCILEWLPFSSTSGDHIDYTKYPGSGDWNIPRMIADVRNTGIRTYLYCTQQSLFVDYMPLIERLSVPLLIMQGRKDSISPLVNSKMLNDKAQDAQRILIENADHIIVLNHTSRICTEIERFLLMNVTHE